MTGAAEILPLGPDGMLVRFSDQLSEPANRAALAFRAVLDEAGLIGVRETATSLTSVLVRFDPGEVARSTLAGTVTDLLGDADWHAAELPDGRRVWSIPASFGGRHGPDLEECADLASVSPDEAAAQICGARLRVLALGFAPGQPYLGFLEDNWDIPRQSAVTPQVPRGAVVVAVRQVIPFANAAPTGWRQVGRTAFRCFDARSDYPIPLRPGDEVRFDAVDATRIDELLELDPPLGGAMQVEPA